MKTSLTILLLIFVLDANIALCQVSKLKKKSFITIATTLSDYSMGSSFSTISFQVITKEKVIINQIHSTNGLTKKRLDSLFKDENSNKLFIKLKTGTYCLPIFQCAYAEDLSLNWVNNKDPDIGFYVKRFILTEETYMLQPFVILSKK